MSAKNKSPNARKGHSKEQTIYALRYAEQGPEGRRNLSGNRRIAAGLLQLEAPICWMGLSELREQSQPAGPEPEGTDSAGGPDARQAQVAGGAVKRPKARGVPRVGAGTAAGPSAE